MVTWDKYPLTLTTTHVKEILDIGNNTVYNLFHQPGFPGIRVGRSFRVSRDAFRRWLERGAA
ncbi:MAG: Helix-turn-helix domain protein [Pelotomaculum sp. PtaU1.Bin065]|nr:MAG: Helix-turn-helix domain protein [Pelotomaculum sp. PtaU1.Bin065]